MCARCVLRADLVGELCYRRGEEKRKSLVNFSLFFFHCRSPQTQKKVSRLIHPHDPFVSSDLRIITSKTLDRCGFFVCVFHSEGESLFSLSSLLVSKEGRAPLPIGTPPYAPKSLWFLSWLGYLCIMNSQKAPRHCQSYHHETELREELPAHTGARAGERIHGRPALVAYPSSISVTIFTLGTEKEGGTFGWAHTHSTLLLLSHFSSGPSFPVDFPCRKPKV